MTAPQRAMADAINKNPEVADTAVRHFFAWGAVIISGIVFVLFWRFGLMPWQKPRRPGEVMPKGLPSSGNTKKNGPHEKESFRPLRPVGHGTSAHQVTESVVEKADELQDAGPV